MKRKMKRIVPAVLSAAMAVSSVPGAAFGAPVVMLLSEEGTDTQMVSDPETVYVNSFNSSERSQDFNDNWRFYLGDAGGAEAVNFDDSSWRTLDLPHDYSIEQEYSSSMEAESGYLPGGTGWYRKNFTLPADAEGKSVRIDFDGVYMNATVYINGHKLGIHPYGYTPFSFDLTPYLNYGDNNVIAVKVEHRIPSSRWYSGSGIYRDVKLSVMPEVHEALNGTKIELPGLEGNRSGDVDVHVETAVQNESDSEAKVTVSHAIYAKDDETKTPIGEVTSEEVKVPAGQTVTVESDMTARNPRLWDTEDPNLYVMETRISAGGTEDVSSSDFGFRYFNFDSETGFSLNGEPMKLKGVCMHHDQGSLGSEAWRRAMERQMDIMKEMGCNAIRVTHNPASKELINICNEKGILVFEELFDGWGNKNANNEDYGKWINVQVEEGNEIIGREDSMKWGEFDIKSLIRRDYNDPCVISWSLGNEVLQGGVSGGTGYPEKASELIGWARETDDTRPVTTGDDNLKNNNANTIEIAKRLTQAGGLVGFNYTTLEQVGRGTSYDEYHKSHPDWKIYGSETASSVNSRGVYNPERDIYDYQLTAYDESCVGWGHLASEAWYDTIRKDYMAGEFVWTGFDYIGEPTNWNGTGSGPAPNTVWPKSPKNSYFGIVDTAGFPKDSYYLYQSLWNDEVNTVHILPAWNEDVVSRDSRGNVKVVVYSDAPNVELVLQPADGGKEISYGTKSMTEVTSQADEGEGMYTYYMYQGEDKDPTAHKNLYRTWTIPYQDGTLTARATDESGRPITDAEGRGSVTTAGEPSRLEMTADRETITADGDDLCYITVDVLDENGNFVPDALNRVTFDVEGDGELVGVDNGWTTDHDSYQADNRRAFNGKVLAIVKSTKQAGSFTVTAKADGLSGDSVTVSTEAAPGQEPGEDSGIEKYEISRNYYVKVGNEPVLPEEVSVTYTDGTTAELPVKWKDIPEDKIGEEGSFTVSGDMDGTIVSVNINMINEIAAILNYSTAVQVGSEPVLPTSRPIVAEDGTILNISLPIEWEKTDAADFEHVGTVEVNGSAQVFGEERDVTATVRVSEQKIEITDNVAPQAKLSQSIPENQTSDTLNAIVDGSTETTNKSDGMGRNQTRWCDWNYIHTNGNGSESEISFTYATQENLGEATVYFVNDGTDLKYPQPGDIKWYYSNDNKTWEELPVQENIGEEEKGSAASVKPYTYKFSPTGITYLKLCIKNTTEGTGVVSTGISEVRLNRAESRFAVSSNAELASLTINGVEVSRSDLKAGEYSTPMSVVEEIEAEGADNTAVTVLPAYEKQVNIILESEDHSVRDTYAIHLEYEPTGAADESYMDYPAEDMEVTVSSEEDPEEGGQEDGAKENAVDDDADTYWHSNWSKGNDGPLWISFELSEETSVCAVRYLPRQSGNGNGRVEGYKVEVSQDGEQWQTAAEGKWKADNSWKLAKFEPVKAKYVRLTGTDTYGDSGRGKFMSAAEVRVRQAEDGKDISNADIRLEQDVFEMDSEGSVFAPKVTVTVDGETLRYGIDYTVAYEKNDKPGNAVVTVKGIMGYYGTVTKEFRIVSDIIQRVDVSGGTITAIEGEESEEERSSAAVETGKTVSVKAKAPEGKEFAYWRAAPQGILAETDRTKEEISFKVPSSSVRLTAVFKDEGAGDVTKEAYSTAKDKEWFAYADEGDMEALLSEVSDSLTEEEKTALDEGGKLEVVLEIENTQKDPSKMDILKRLRDRLKPDQGDKATASDAAEIKPAAPKATASDASEAKARTAVKATASDAAPQEQEYARDILKASVLSPKRAVEQETDFDEASMGRFWIMTETSKRVTDQDGRKVTDKNLTKADCGDAIEITAGIPEKHQNMADYQVVEYEVEGDTSTVSLIDTDAPDEDLYGTDLRFDASVDGIYAVVYKKCFDVTFVDWDGSVISVEGKPSQRIEYGQAARIPEAPEREGYIFTGWDREEELDEVVSDLVVKAQYEKIQDEVDKSELQEFFDEIAEEIEDGILRESDYTEESWKKLEDALAEAEKVLDDEDAKEAEIKAALNALKKAYDGLKDKPQEPEEPDKPQEPEVPENPGSHHSGGGKNSWVTGGHYYASQAGLFETISDPSVPLAAGPDVTAGIWGQTEAGWTFTKDTGEQAVSTWIYTLWNNVCDWYYFDENGIMATGWLKLDGNTFYLNPVSDGTRGSMVDGWNLIDGKWYYFNPVSDGTRGALYRNRVTPDGYRVGPDGAWN